MSETTTEPIAHALRVSRRIRATPERLFRLWTDPAQLRHWWRMDGPGWAFAGAEIDLRVGGAYRLSMTGPDGQEHVAVGVYRELAPPVRLAFTWDWENPAHRTMPGAYTSPNNSTNPLFNSPRSMAPGDILDAMDGQPATALSETNFADFSPELEGSPHGSIHNAAGGDMSFFDTAAKARSSMPITPTSTSSGPTGPRPTRRTPLLLPPPG